MNTGCVTSIGEVPISRLVVAGAALQGSGLASQVTSPVRAGHGYVKAIQSYRPGDNKSANASTRLGGPAGGGGIGGGTAKNIVPAMCAMCIHSA